MDSANAAGSPPGARPVRAPNAHLRAATPRTRSTVAHQQSMHRRTRATGIYLGTTAPRIRETAARKQSMHIRSRATASAPVQRPLTINPCTAAAVQRPPAPVPRPPQAIQARPQPRNEHPQAIHNSQTSPNTLKTNTLRRKTGDLDRRGKIDFTKSEIIRLRNRELVDQSTSIRDLVIQFSGSEPGDRFLEAWKKSRIIVDAGHGPGEEEEAPSPIPAPPAS